MANEQINQHKRMAMGQRPKVECGGTIKMARGGAVSGFKSKGVMPAIKGAPMSPLTKAKMSNGIPGFKKGGKC